MTSVDFFKKNIHLNLFERFVCERELETEQNCNILTPTLMAISVSFFGGARGVMVIVTGYVHGDTSSIPEQD